MSTLKGLAATGRGLVSEEFRRGDQPTVDPSGHVEDLQFGREIDLDPLRTVLEAVMRDRKPRDSDPWLGPRVHATLRLTRREAADKRVWNYLSLVEFPDYIRWRWTNPDRPDDVAPLDRFLGEDSKNALARLWWAAELTRNGSSYERTETALRISRFSVSWLHLILMHHRAAALAVVDFLHTFNTGGATDTQGQVMAKAVNVALRTVSLDALAVSPPPDTEAVREWAAEKVDATLMLDRVPTGPDDTPVPAESVATVRRFLDTLADRIGLVQVKGERRAPLLPSKE
jgi:hypothetical protein